MKTSILGDWAGLDFRCVGGDIGEESIFLGDGSRLVLGGVDHFLVGGESGFVGSAVLDITMGALFWPSVRAERWGYLKGN